MVDDARRTHAPLPGQDAAQVGSHSGLNPAINGCRHRLERRISAADSSLAVECRVRIHSGMPLVAGTKLGPYEIAGALGAGGMGQVYRATDARLDRVVAIKVLHDGLTGSQMLERQREARAASALMHRTPLTARASSIVTSSLRTFQ